MKGLELHSDARMSEVISEELGIPANRIAVVSGPNLAMEIAREEPTASVVACSDPIAAGWIARSCTAPYFRPYTTGDVVGVEIGGIVKNIIALAVGICEGKQMGDNTKASVITRGLAETSRLSLALGGEAQTMAGLAGLGDLVATCSSPLSRNHTAGRLLGKGLTLDEVDGRNDADGRGDQVRPGRPGAGRQARRRDAHHRGGRSRAGRKTVRRRTGAAPAVPGPETRRRLLSVSEENVSTEARSASRPRVAVLFGGRSSEHAVSCVTAAGVLGAIDQTKYEVIPIGIAKTGQWVLASGDTHDWSLSASSLPEVASSARTVALTEIGGEHQLIVASPNEVPQELGAVDVVFPLLHGPFGEDGTVQGFLELSDTRYVGAGVLASAVGMDKHFMKVVFESAGLRVGRTSPSRQVGSWCNDPRPPAAAITTVPSTGRSGRNPAGRFTATSGTKA